MQSQLEERIAVPLHHPPQVTLEELDRDEVVVRILATPQDPGDGSSLASEVLEAVRENGLVGEGARP